MIHRTALLILCPFALLSLSSSLHGQGKTARPELSIQHGHYASVADVCYSPDGKLIATSAKRVILWDAQTGRQIRILPVSALEPDVLQFSPDGKYLAVAPGVYMVNGTITLWEVATGKKVLTTKLCSGHAKVRFSPDGSQFISTYQGGVAVWSTATGREMHYLFSRHSNASIPFVSTLIYTSDGKHIVALYSDHFLTVWNAQSGKKLQSFRSPVRGEASCDLSPAGKHLVIRREKTVEIRESRTFKLISTFKADPVFSTASFTPDGARVAIQNSSHAISIRSTATGKEAMRLKSLNGFLISSFSPDGKRIVTSANGKEVLVWDVLTGKRLLQLASPADWLQVMALSPDGKLLATGSDTCVQIRDAVTLVPRRIYKAHTASISDF